MVHLQTELRDRIWRVDICNLAIYGSHSREGTIRNTILRFATPAGIRATTPVGNLDLARIQRQAPHVAHCRLLGPGKMRGIICYSHAGNSVRGREHLRRPIRVLKERVYCWWFLSSLVPLLCFSIRDRTTEIIIRLYRPLPEIILGTYQSLILHWSFIDRTQILMHLGQSRIKKANILKEAKCSTVSPNLPVTKRGKWRRYIPTERRQQGFYHKVRYE